MLYQVILHISCHQGPVITFSDTGGILALNDNCALLPSLLVTQEVMRDLVNAMNGDIPGSICLSWMSSRQQTLEPRKK